MIRKKEIRKEKKVTEEGRRNVEECEEEEEGKDSWRVRDKMMERWREGGREVEGEGEGREVREIIKMPERKVYRAREKGRERREEGKGREEG